jgi:hypothetical protein
MKTKVGGETKGKSLIVFRGWRFNAVRDIKKAVHLLGEPLLIK